MCADIFGIEMHCAKIPHASLVGAAVLAMEVTGYIDSIESYTIKADEIARPDPERHGLYAERYQKYLEYYSATGKR
jgi:sugar (pentulose or hexulose) kinase